MGCGGFTSRKPEDERESIATIRAALDAGISFLDTADFYGMGQSESLIVRALKGRRSQAFLSMFYTSATRILNGKNINYGVAFGTVMAAAGQGQAGIALGIRHAF